MKIPFTKHRIINRRDALAVLGLVTVGLATTARAHHGSGAEATDQLALGAADAPVTMIEFSSLTCPHCAAFHNDSLPAIKANYIDTGKVKLVYRDFPLNKAALLGSALAHCAGPDRFFGFIDVLFKSQASWARSDDPVPALTQIGRLGGLKAADIEVCLNDKELFDRILSSRVEGAKEFNITSTPTFIINGEKHAGALPYEQFAAVFERLLKGV
jgi:protein-disulfide isomerase